MPAPPPDEARALEALDRSALQADLAALVRIPSPTGQERSAMEAFAGLAAAQGLRAELHEHDLAALRAHPDHPGEEAPRDELVGATATLPGPPGGPRLCLNGHLDVVDPGTVAWRDGPWSAAVRDGALYGRGAVDMKAGVVAALHALGAIGRAGLAPAGEVVLQAVASEEDGGLGTVAALQRDAAFAAALIPEPTGFQIVCAQAGALTFTGRVPGVAAHAAVRREGVSAIDRYVPVHVALGEHERALNASVEHELMRALGLPYPVSVGRLEAGSWSSSVPDLLRFEGRLGVRVGEDVAQARAALEARVAQACPQATLEWTGGQFASGQTPPEHPWVAEVAGAAADELGAPPPLAGSPYGADLRHFSARAIPCVMFGTTGLEHAHAVDERVVLDELQRLARVLVRVVLRFGR